MIAQRTQHDVSLEFELQGVVEPLASYICAADRPRAALASALRALLREVQQTQGAALSYVGAVRRSVGK